MKINELTHSHLQRMILLGIIVATKVILMQFTIGPVFVKVSLGFLGSVLLGYLFGPIWGAVGGGLSDLLASALFGNQGGFFLGFTLTAMLAPFFYGLFFYQKAVSLWRIVIATLLVTLVINLGLNTLWIHLLYGLNLKVAFLARLPKEIISPWFQMAIIYFVLATLDRVKDKRHFS